MGNYAPRLEVKHDWVKEQLDSCAFKIPEKFIVFTPGAIYGPSKQWPVEHFRKLGKQLHKAFGYTILLLGTIDDVKSGTKIAHNHDWTHNFCGRQHLHNCWQS